MSLINESIAKQVLFDYLTNEVMTVENLLKERKTELDKEIKDYAVSFDESFDGSFEALSVLLNKNNFLYKGRLKKVEEFLSSYGLRYISRGFRGRTSSVSLSFSLKDKEVDLKKTLDFLEENYMAIYPEKELIIDEENEPLIEGYCRYIEFKDERRDTYGIVIDENGRFQIFKSGIHPEKDIYQTSKISPVFDNWSDMTKALMSSY